MSSRTAATQVEAAVEQVVARSPWGRFRSVFARDDHAHASEEELVQRLADAEGLVSQLMAQQADDLMALRELRLATQRQTAPDGHEPDACTRGCCDPDGWMGLEVAQALAVTERQVGARIDTAERLARFGQLRDAVEHGRVQSWTAIKLAEHLAELATLVSADRLEQVESATIAWLTDRPRTVGQVNARMRRLIAAAGDEAGLDQPRRNARDRRAWVNPAGSDGLATVVARLPEADALAVKAVLAALAADPVAEDDARTREQRRADLITAMITGVPAAYGCADDVDLLVRSLGSLAVQVTVTVPADALTGDTTPAEVPGYGPVSATTARDLAAAATSCQALIYHPDTGHLLGLSDSGQRMRWLEGLPSSTSYSHPPVMERLVHARDRTCRAPGCTRVAHACDCDHVVPWPRGQTTADNTCCLCRRHHRLKTHAPGWNVALDDTGRLVWTTPTGRTLTTEPHDYSRDRGDRGSGDGDHDGGADGDGDSGEPGF